MHVSPLHMVSRTQFRKFFCVVVPIERLAMLLPLWAVFLCYPLGAHTHL